MPLVDWGIDPRVIDEWDRDSQFKPYTGVVPPNGAYLWKIKTLKFSAPTDDKNPQLRAGLELVPRTKEEKRFAGYFIVKFMTVTERSVMFYTPFLDAIGVSSDDFTERTRTDEEGNVRKIGQWKMDGSTKILGQLQDDTDQNGNPRKAVGWVGASDEPVEAEEEEYDDEEEEEEAPPPRRRAAKATSSRTSRSSRSTARRSSAPKRSRADDYFDEE